MNTSSRSVLLRAIAMVCFFGFVAAHSQSSDISIKVDLSRKEIVTYVTLREVPKGVDIIWQQKIPKEAHFLSHGRGNQNADSKVMMMSFSRHLLAPTMSFSFICKMDTIGDWIVWGESSITYTTKEGKDRVSKFPARLFIIKDHLMESSEEFAQQETVLYLEENNDAKMSNIIMVTIPDEAKVQSDIAVKPSQNIVKTEETAIDTNKKIGLNVAQQESIATTVVLQEPVQTIITPQELVPVTVVSQVQEQEPEPIPTTTVPQESVQETVASQTSPQTDPSLKSGFYIQISAFKTKRNLAEIKNHVHLLKGDNLAEMKKEKFFVYLVGPFLTRKEASDKLTEHYKKHVPDAYVIKL